MLLQSEVNQASLEIEQLEGLLRERRKELQGFAPLLSDRDTFDLFPSLRIKQVKKRDENIAGIDVPMFEEVIFDDHPYSLFDSPVWIDSAIGWMQRAISLKEQIRTVHERRAVLEVELREVSIHVNLFEKILIPRAQGHIKKIKTFLGDQQLAAVCQAKVAKRKIEERRER
jgi:V/A-type H+-transporting ATPase subunit D